MSTRISIDGSCNDRFKAVRETFVDNFGDYGDVGAAVCVYVGGEPVVDLWGGFADAARSRPWQRHTIVNVASTTKGMTATCAHILVERGELNLDAPVTHYWPEFAQANKDALPVRLLLSHRAGLVGVRQDMPPETLYEWHRYSSALAAEEPWWKPGEQHGYHALTFGYLVGEVVRRITGQSLGSFFQAEVAQPLGADFYIGVPESADSLAAEVLPNLPLPPDEQTLFDGILDKPESMAYRAFFNPPRQPNVMNHRQWRKAEIPATNGHTSASALARIYGALACGGALDGIPILQRLTLETAIEEQSYGIDAVLGFATRFGLGYMLTSPERPFGPNPRAFGHPGMGGSLGFADLDARVGFGYVMNQYQASTPHYPDRRATRLVDAVYQSL